MLVITVQANLVTGLPRPLTFQNKLSYTHRCSKFFYNPLSLSVCLSVGLWLQSLVVSVGVQRALLPGHRPVCGHLHCCGVDRTQSGQGAPSKPAQQDHTGPHEVPHAVCVNVLKHCFIMCETERQMCAR